MRRAIIVGLAVSLSTAIGLSIDVGTAFAAAAPSASTGHVAERQPTTVTVTGTVNPNGLTTTYYFEYGVGTSLGSKTASQSAGAGTADVHVSGSITGLAPATEYSYRIVATNGAGTTDGGTGIFSTSAPPYVGTNAASKLTTSSATLNGVVNSEGLTTSWYFQYGTTTSYGSTTPATTLAAGPNDTDVSVSVSKLAPDTTYHYSLVATSSAGASKGTDQVLVTGRSVTLDASANDVVYGGKVTLSGAVASGLSGVPVMILSQQYNQSSFSAEGTILSGSGGAWSYSMPMSIDTTFEAEATAGTSSPVSVGVQPAVFVGMARNHRVTTHIVAATSYASQVVQLQRFTGGLWVTWKPVRLNSNAKVTFATRLPVGTPIRIATIGTMDIGVGQTVPGYLQGISRVISYIRK